MDELFNKPVILNQLSEEEKSRLTDKQKKALKDLIDYTKPSVSFSKATINDCIRSDGLALNIDYASVKAPTIHIPVDFRARAASAHKLKRFWCWTTKMPEFTLIFISRFVALNFRSIMKI